MNLDDIVQRVDQIIDLGRKVLATRHRSNYDDTLWIDSAKMKGFRSSALSFIERVYGSRHPHYMEFSSVSHYHPEDVEAGIAIMEAIRDEISGGWLFSVKNLITAEIFADFMEMAEHLLAEGYKDPAAVMAGSVLEEHLRQLCLRNQIEIEVDSKGKMKPKKADRLNSELSQAEVFGKLDQKAVTTWLDLRNKAAHGKYNEYTAEQVQNMIHGITEFVARVKC